MAIILLGICMNPKFKKLPIFFSILLFIFFTGWWVVLNFTSAGVEESNRQLFSTFYALQALFGGILGLAVGRKWGGFSSYLGRAILFLSLGLLAQVFGQIVYSYYNLYLKVFVPYPSLGDLGYFGSIPLYIYGAAMLAKATAVQLNLLKSFITRLWAIGLVALFVLGSLFILRNGYAPDWGQPLIVFLDFGYPVFQAIYISVALITLLISFGKLGGLLRKSILLVLFAFIVQYTADFNFLYTINNETWQIAGIGEYFYYFAYLIMTLAIISLGSVFDRIKSNKF